MNRPSGDGGQERVRSLIGAAARGDVQTVRELIDGDPGLVREEGPHPVWGGRLRALHVAVERGRTEVVGALLSAGADPSPDSTAYDGWTPMILAAAGGHREVMARLREAGAVVDPWTAALTGDEEAIRALLAAEPDAVHRLGPNRATPLHFAATEPVARLLVGAGADLAVQDKYGRTPVRTVSYSRTATREAGRYLHGQEGEDDPFLRCALDDRDSLARAVDERPALLVVFDDHLNAASSRGATLLHLAASLSNHAMVELLLDRGADPDIRALEGEVPLHYAARFGDRRMVQLLLSRGADPSVRDGVQDATPATWADFFGHPEMVSLLDGGG